MTITLQKNIVTLVETPIRCSGSFEISATLEYDDPYMQARLEEHIEPVRGEVNGGAQDGLSLINSGDAEGSAENV